MTDVRETGSQPDDASAAREEAQRRIEEIMAGRAAADDDESKVRRRRAILGVLLIALLLGLFGAGAYLWRILSPSTGASESELAGITWIRSIYGYGPDESQQFINPNDAATGPDGVIWVADPGTGQIAGFRGDGTYVDRVTANTQTGDPFRVPSRIAVDSDGIMYVVDRANSALTIMDGNQRLAQANIPGAMSVDVSDDIVVVGSQSGFAILDKDGNVQTIVGSTRGKGDDQFDVVSGVAIDSERRSIYVVDTYNNRLSAWDFAGKNKWTVSLGNAGNDVKLEGGRSLLTSTTAPAALQLPTDVTIDGKGRPAILDGFDFTISFFEPNDGSFVEKWGSYGDQDGQFMYPTGLSYDVAKDWFLVADTNNARAQIVRVAGTGPAGGAGLVAGFNRLMAGPLRALWPCAVLLPLLLVVILISRARRRRLEGAGNQALEAG